MAKLPIRPGAEGEDRELCILIRRVEMQGKVSGERIQYILIHWPPMLRVLIGAERNLEFQMRPSEYHSAQNDDLLSRKLAA